jgi:corrinoid protein of di/trimethylamine methyltransferase
MENEKLMESLAEAVIEGDDVKAVEISKKALEQGMVPLDIVKAGIQPAMDIVGDRFQAGEAYLPELIVAGDAATAALDVLLDQLSGDESAAAKKGTVILGVMFGDNHDIGKNLVQAVLAANGFKVIDMGVNVPPKAFIEAAIKEKADIIASSTLITTSLPYQRELIELLKAMGKREDFFIILGGGPVTPEWTQKIGADGYGRDAKDAVTLCLKLISGEFEPGLEEPIIENALRAS